MELIKLLELYEKLTNLNKPYTEEPLKIKDGCAAEAKFHYEYEISHLIIWLINHQEDAKLLERLIFKYEKTKWAHYNIIHALYRKCLSINKTDKELYKRFTDYLLLHYYAYPETVEQAKRINHFVDLQEFDKALELVSKNT